MRVFNDHLLVEIKKSEWVTSEDAEEHSSPKASFGVVVAIPEPSDIMYFSNYSWILENSVFNVEIVNEMYSRMKSLLNKTIYWEQRAEIGNVIEEDGRTFATIKLSKVIGVQE